MNQDREFWKYGVWTTCFSSNFFWEISSYLQVSDDEDDDEISHDSEEEERELQIEENMSNLKEAVASLGVK